MELGGFIHRLHRLPQIILTEGPHVFPCQIGKGQVNSSRYVRSHSERKLALQRKQIAWRFQKGLSLPRYGRAEARVHPVDGQIAL